MANNNKVFSKYLNTEIEVPLSEFDNDGERVIVIPYAVLDDIITNHPVCVENEVECHYTQINSSFGSHFGFFCRINDNKGRAVEGFGESLPETCDTPIARKNPAKMAVKRAFSDAAIKFLRLPRSFSDVAGVDVEIVGGDGTTKSARKATKKAAPVPELDEALKPDGDLAAMLEEAAKAIPEAPMDEKPKKATRKKKEAETPVEAPAEAPVSDPAVVEDKMEDFDPANPFADFPEMDGDPFAEETSLAGDLESEPDVEVSSALPAGPDIYDTTIVTAGSLKAKNYSIRQCYDEDPSAIHWIAEKMSPRRDEMKTLQKLCQDFLKLVEG